MPKKTRNRLLTACCCMELCWLCAWSHYLIVSTTKTIFPIGVFCSAFLIALFLSSFFKTKNYRLIYILLVNIIGAAAMIIIGIYVSIGLIMPTGVYEWYQMILIITLICLFWYKGNKISHRKMSYKSTCNHFDLGISLLFVLLVIKFLIQLKAGVSASDPFTLYCIIFYFFPGLTAIFLSNNATARGKRYSKGFQIYGVLLSSLMTLIFFSMAVFLILLPFMTSFAESGYTVLKQTTDYLSPYFFAILKFIFSIPNNPVSNNTTSQNKTIANIDVIQTHGQTGMDVFVYYGIMIFMIAAFIFFIGYIIFILFKFLMSKQTPTTQINKDNAPLFSRLLGWLVFFFSTLKKAILSLTEKVGDAKKGFKKLVLWGKRSGMPIQQNETPAEYGKRLKQQFSPLENEILTIIHAFQLETYGEMRIDSTRISKVVKAVKTINSPFFWTLRIKSIWKIRSGLIQSHTDYKANCYTKTYKY